MYKKTIAYTDYNGNQREEDFYFNLNASEIVKLEVTTEGGLEAYVREISSTLDGQRIMEFFEKLIETSYGKKSLDGRSFIKRPEYFEEFKGTEAYNTLFLELIQDAEAGVKFFNAVVPQDVAKAKTAIPESVN